MTKLQIRKVAAAIYEKDYARRATFDCTFAKLDRIAKLHYLNMAKAAIAAMAPKTAVGRSNE